ncbi:conserved hypothetical protein [Histoplasma mississippiense (nom. inval.)]|uniref:conserved hypothetical protein n=1 Tax=Ajellomyces capsulatus (strain NAm1 / WU24) TaxID=2059318 RepID=UPI000157C3B0|nr:conserved hypothetical protein [Histoplasma mississippiense (nom. inval.)]EDN07484.1 conserved hypothetical protein [Histoplasma mississippiense (nom. inval.)]
MAGRFVRSSKYRHIFGRSTRKEQCYDNLHISKNAWDTNLVKVNPKYISVNWETSGGGAFAVLPLHETGKAPDRFPLFRGHTAVVLDTDWNPFNDSLIASGSDDGKVFLWRVPENFTLHTNAEEIADVAPVGKLSGHPRKVGHVLFNPAAENVLASSSGDYTVKIWDIESGSSKLTLKHAEVIQSLSWSANGSIDGNIRYFEYENDKFEYLSEYKSADPQRGIAFMPKRGVNMHDNEVVRALKTVNDTYIEPISFIVPRRAEMFQDDIYPPTTGLKPAMSAAEWFDGKEALPPKIDLGSLYGGEGLKEVSPLSPPNAAQKHSSPVQQGEPTPKEPYPSKPAAVSGRVDTPPSVKEQSSSIAAMASKYADDEETDGDLDDGSSFEQVQKPASSRPPAITFSPPEISEATPSSKVVPKVDLPSTDSTAEKSSTSTRITDISAGVQDLVQRELSSLKSLISEQGRTIAAQTRQIEFLTNEIEDLKARLT